MAYTAGSNIESIVIGDSSSWSDEASSTTYSEIVEYTWSETLEADDPRDVSSWSSESSETTLEPTITESDWSEESSDITPIRPPFAPIVYGYVGVFTTSSTDLRFKGEWGFEMSLNTVRKRTKISEDNNILIDEQEYDAYIHDWQTIGA